MRDMQWFAVIKLINLLIVRLKILQSYCFFVVLEFNHSWNQIKSI